jgi:hypothetical protein
VTPPRKLTPEDREEIARMAREYVGGDDPRTDALIALRDRDSVDPIAIAHEVRVYSASRPPPPALVVVQERVRMRDRSNTDRFDIEELQKQLRESTERAAAEKIAEARERALKAEAEKKDLEASVEKRVEKASDRRWEILLAVLAAIFAALAGRYIH